MLTNQNLFDTMEPSKGIFAEWCNGSTADSDSVCEGSNPSSAARWHLDASHTWKQAKSLSFVFVILVFIGHIMRRHDENC